MRANRKLTMAITLIAALLMAVLTTGSTLAQESTEIINGIVVTINADGSIVIDTDGDLKTTDDQVTVFIGENSKFPTVAEGDSINATGTRGDDGELVRAAGEEGPAVEVTGLESAVDREIGGIGLGKSRGESHDGDGDR